MMQYILCSVLGFKHRILHPWFFGVLMWVEESLMIWQCGDQNWTEGRWEEVPKRTGETYFRSHLRIEEIHKHPVSNVVYCHHQTFFCLSSGNEKHISSENWEAMPDVMQLRPPMIHQVLITTPPKTNMEHENTPERSRIKIYKPLIFGFYVKFCGCNEWLYFTLGWLGFP